MSPAFYVFASSQKETILHFELNIAFNILFSVLANMYAFLSYIYFNGARGLLGGVLYKS